MPTPGQILAKQLQANTPPTKKDDQELTNASKKALGPACTNFTITHHPQEPKPEPTQAHKDGQTAHILLLSTGVTGSKDKNPHKPDTKDHQDWNTGWEEIQTLKQQKPLWQEP